MFEAIITRLVCMGWEQTAHASNGIMVFVKNNRIAWVYQDGFVLFFRRNS